MEKSDLALQLTLKAIDHGFLKIKPDTLNLQEETGKAIATLYNAILVTLKV